MQRRWEDLTGKLSCTFHVSLSCLWVQNWVEAANSVGTTMSLVIDQLSMMFCEFKPCPGCR